MSSEPTSTLLAREADAPFPLAAATLCEAFQRTAAEHSERLALRTPDNSTSITWEQYAHRVQRIAAGLASLGIGRGETVGLMLVNRPEFNLIDTAALHLGATPFSIYHSSTAEQIAYLLENAANQVLVTERRFLPVITEAIAAGGSVEHVVLVDGEEDTTISLGALEVMGNPAFDFGAAWRRWGPRTWRR